jgi:hypothetical protein
VSPGCSARRSRAALRGANETSFCTCRVATGAKARDVGPYSCFSTATANAATPEQSSTFCSKNGPLYEACIQKRDLPLIVVAPQLPMYGRDAYADYLKNRTRGEIPVRLAAGTPP